MKAGDFVISGFGHLPMDTHEKDAVGMPMPTPHV